MPEVPSTLVRLARWVRLRFSDEARRAVEAERRWATALAREIGGTLHEVHLAGNVLLLEVTLEVTLAALPSVEALYRWLRRLRDEHEARIRPA